MSFIISELQDAINRTKGMIFLVKLNKKDSSISDTQCDHLLARVSEMLKVNASLIDKSKPLI